MTTIRELTYEDLRDRLEDEWRETTILHRNGEVKSLAKYIQHHPLGTRFIELALTREETTRPTTGDDR